MKSRHLQVGVVLLVTVALCYFVASQLRVADLAQLWGASNPLLLLVGFFFYFCANVLRAWRFRALTVNRIPTLLLLRTVVIQNCLNTFLPLRAGEVSYLVMVHRTGALKPGENLGSLVGARILDLVAALAIPLATLPLSSAWSPQIFAWFAAIAVASLVGLAVGVWQAGRLASGLERLGQRRHGLLAKGLALAADALRSFAQLRQSRVVGRIAALTFGCWALIYLCGYASLLGVGIQVRFWDGLFAYSFPMIASMTPLFMLGGFGVFESSIGMGLKLVGVPLSTAMAGAVLLHIAELIYVLLPTPLALTPATTARARSDENQATRNTRSPNVN